MVSPQQPEQCVVVCLFPRAAPTVARGRIAHPMHRQRVGRADAPARVTGQDHDGIAPIHPAALQQQVVEDLSELIEIRGNLHRHGRHAVEHGDAPQGREIVRADDDGDAEVVLAQVQRRQA